MGRVLLAAVMVLAAGSRDLLARGDGTFGSKSQLESTDLGAGGGPALAAGDFNHDGQLDLAAANIVGEVQVLLQDPLDRTVWKKLPLPQASGNYFLRAADFDGDGIDDLVGAIPGSGAFFHRARGDGSFASVARVEGSFGPRWLTVGDFDRDGDVDLAGAEQNLGMVFVSAGGGKEVFSLLQKILTNGRPHSVEALDYDGDGTPDLAAGTTSGLELLKMGADGRFKLQHGQGVNGFCYHYQAVGDFNADGLEDVTSACAAYLSRGDGTFTKQAVAGSDSPVVVADLNGDTRGDIAFLLSWGIAIQRGSGDGRFGLPLFFGPAGQSSYRAAILARDLDGDHHADLVAPGIGSSALGVLWGKDGGFMQSTVLAIAGSGPVKDMAVADLDADGSPDLLFARADQPRIDANLLRPGRGDLVLSTFTIDPANFYTSLEAADLDGDGWLDLAGTKYTGGVVLVTLLEAGGKVRTRTAAPAGSFPAGVVLGRFGGDEVTDLVVPCSGSSHLAVFQGLGSGAFASAKDFPSITRPKDLALSDLDGDGVLDAAVISTEEVGVQFGTGAANLGEPVRVDRNEARRYVDLAIADLSGDGFPDLIAMEKTRGLQVFQGAGGRTFQARDPVALYAGEAVALAAADLNGDGLTDATITSTKPSPDGATTESSLAVLLNRDAGLGPRTLYNLPFAPLGHKLADLDQDGALDVVAYDLYTALVLFGNAAPPIAERFRRGDVDGDGAMEINDAIAILDRLFLGGEAPGCPDAADANDDGELNLTDPIAILSRLFLGGNALPPPGPLDCGFDPTPDGLPACLRRC